MERESYNGERKLDRYVRILNALEAPQLHIEDKNMYLTVLFRGLEIPA